MGVRRRAPEAASTVVPAGMCRYHVAVAARQEADASGAGSLCVGRAAKTPPRVDSEALAGIAEELPLTAAELRAIADKVAPYMR